MIETASESCCGRVGVLVSRARSYGNLDSAVVNSWLVIVHSWLVIVLVAKTNE